MCETRFQTFTFKIIESTECTFGSYAPAAITMDMHAIYAMLYDAKSFASVAIRIYVGHAVTDVFGRETPF